MKLEYIILAVLGVFIWYEFRGMDSAGKAVVPQNALGIPDAPPAPSVAKGASELTGAQSGFGLFPDTSGLGNNPVPHPTSDLSKTLLDLQSGAGTGETHYVTPPGSDVPIGIRGSLGGPTNVWNGKYIAAPDESGYVAPANAVSKLFNLTGQEAYNLDNEVGDYTPGSPKNPFATYN